MSYCWSVVADDWKFPNSAHPGWRPIPAKCVREAQQRRTGGTGTTHNMGEQRVSSADLTNRDNSRTVHAILQRMVLTYIITTLPSAVNMIAVFLVAVALHEEVGLSDGIHISPSSTHASVPEQARVLTSRLVGQTRWNRENMRIFNQASQNGPKVGNICPLRRRGRIWRPESAPVPGIIVYAELHDDIKVIKDDVGKIFWARSRRMQQPR